jgi:hypothetical protein
VKIKKTTAPVESTAQDNQEIVSAEYLANDAPAVATEPKVKETPVEERQYRLVTPTDEPLKFRGKQRQVVYDVLRAHEGAMTIAQVAELADKLELKAVGGTEPSVRYHLHHMTKDGLTEVVNPTITVE